MTAVESQDGQASQVSTRLPRSGSRELASDVMAWTASLQGKEPGGRVQSSRNSSGPRPGRGESGEEGIHVQGLSFKTRPWPPLLLDFPPSLSRDRLQVLKCAFLIR